jgi:O-antigen/teichoic acid export membrane protein
MGVSGHSIEEVKTSSLISRLGNLLSSRYVVSVGAQAVVSGFHFSLNLMLLRLVTPYEYGVFAYAFVLAMFASAINNALIATPLTVYTPIIKDSEERASQESMFSTLNLLLFTTLVLAGLIYSWVSNLESSTTVGVTAFVAVYAARQYSRCVGYARLRPLVPAAGDIAYVVAGVTLVAALVYSLDSLAIGHVLMALAAANCFAMLVERLFLHGRHHQWLTIAKLGGYGEIWKQSRWALIGSLTTLFLAQAHSLIITSTHGPDAYAPLAAGFVLFGPVRIALLTWQNMVKPELAVALSESRIAAVQSQIKRTSLLMGLAVILLGVTLFLAWPWLNDFLYARRYADQPMARIVGIWSVITFFAAIYNAPAAALQAMRDFRVLAMASMYGAVLSGTTVWLTLYWFKPETTLFGILAAECFMAIYLTRVMHQRLKARQ